MPSLPAFLLVIHPGGPETKPSAKETIGGSSQGAQGESEPPDTETNESDGTTQPPDEELNETDGTTQPPDEELNETDVQHRPRKIRITRATPPANLKEALGSKFCIAGSV